MLFRRRRRTGAAETIILSASLASLIAAPDFISCIFNKRAKGVNQSATSLAASRSKSVSFSASNATIPAQSQSPRKLSPRRISSAPASQQSFDALNTLLESSDKNLDLFDDTFIVASVRAKVEKRNEKASAATNEHSHENWDTDFEDEELSLPTIVTESQQMILKDGINMQKFAWHMEDLKLLYLEAQDMKHGISDSTISFKYKEELEDTRVLINLADELDDSNTNSTRQNPDDFIILSKILGKRAPITPVTAVLDTENDDDNDEDWDVAVDDKTRMDFSVLDLPALIAYIEPLKKKMSEYIGDIRGVLME